MNCRYFVRRSNKRKILAPEHGFAPETWQPHCRLKESSPQRLREVNDGLLAAGFPNAMLGTFCPVKDGEEARCPSCAA